LRAAKKNSLPAAVAGGAIWGLAYLVRPEGLVIGTIFVFMIGLSVFFVHRNIARSANVVLAGGLALLIVAAPYIVDLSQKAEQFRWEGKSGVNAIIGERLRQGMPYGEAARGLTKDGEAAGPMLKLEDQTWLLRDKKASALSMSSGLLSNPFDRIRSILIGVFVAKHLTSPWIFIFVAIGFLVTMWWRQNLLYGSFAAGFGLLTLMVAVSTDVRFARFLIPLFPTVLIWAAGGIGFVVQKLTQIGARHPAVPRQTTGVLLSSILCLGLCLAAIQPTLALGEFSQAKRISARAMGELIGQDFQGGLDKRTRRPIIAGFRLAPTYYARGIHKYLAFAPEDLAIGYIHKMSPDYVVLQDVETSQAPYVGSWLENGIPDSCALELLKANDSSSDEEIRVWSWNCRH
jgi:hypothetical protein